MENVKPIVIGAEILIALGYFLDKKGISWFNSSIETLHRWFYDHRQELPCDLAFGNRGYGPDSNDLRQTLAILSMSKMTYYKTSDKGKFTYFDPIVSKAYQSGIKSKLDLHGLNEDILRRLAESFAESCCQAG